MALKRQPLGFALRDPYPWEELAGLARVGEALGYRALFMPEIGTRDVLATLAALAGEVSALQLAPGILPMGARSPVQLARAAATVQERSGGRLILGLGTGPAAPGALARLRELVVGLRQLFAGSEAEIAGDTIRLSFIPEPAPPIWIAALGPNAVRLAGEVADGVVLNWCTPERVARAREEVAEGAARSGRTADDVTIAAYVRSCLDADEAAALGALSAAAAEYAGYAAYRQQFAALGLVDEAAASGSAADGYPPEVLEQLVRAVCLLGPAAAARAKLEAYRAAGADLPIVYPVVVGGPDGRAASALASLEGLAPS